MFPIAVGKGSPDVPITGVSWRDASAYAAWRTRKTGVVHRLPTDEEWAFAAAEKARDKALPLVDPSDPAQAWIARYENEFSRDRPQNSAPQPGGAFGTNSKGLDDFAGTVWEWTDTCFVRSSLDNGRERVINTNCGVRVVEGATVPDFIRDRKSGRLCRRRPADQSGLSPRCRTVAVGLRRRRQARVQAAAAEWKSKGREDCTRATSLLLKAARWSGSRRRDTRD
ncbi:SUMF1/EgtB/PvdO family nonheme iron enzyme (plasmid) [Bradyrhizobium sp. PMVTL-01]|uniref:SUMF1/EgtB/PvdO family nonheme iron enzyme n=1 Tax=Bradyrhizobium sp. PMVTL-01 TaxID=3434999 RepID=UPI003F723B63